jgi:hypothetical protein
MNEAVRIVDQFIDGQLDAETQQAVVQRLANDTALRQAVIQEWHFQRHISCLMAPADGEALCKRVEYGLRFSSSSSGAQRSLAALQRRISARLKNRQSKRQTMWWPLAATLAAAAVLAIALMIGHYDSSRPVEVQPSASGVQVTSVKGEVRVKRAEVLLVVQPNMKLQLQDRLETQAYSTVDLTMSDGSRIQLAASSVMGLSAEAHFWLEQGAIEVSAQPRPAHSPLTFATPRALTTVVGTRFALHHRDDQTALRVTEGIVRFAPVGADARLVRAGEEATSPRALAIASPVSGPPHADPSDANRLLGFRFVDAVSGDTLPGWELVTQDVVVDLAHMPAKGWTVIAVFTQSNKPAVQFFVDGKPVRGLETIHPIALTISRGNKTSSPDFKPWNPTPGTHRLEAVLSSSQTELRPYGTPLAINVTIIAAP